MGADDVRELSRSLQALHRRLDELGERVTTLEARMAMLTEQVAARLDDLRNLPVLVAKVETEIGAMRRELEGHKKRSNGNSETWRLVVAALGWIFGLITLILSRLLQ